MKKWGDSRTWTRDSTVANFIYLQTLYITCLGGGSFCYIPFSLLRRPNNNTATNNNKNNTNTNNDNNNTNNNDNSNNNKDLFTSSIFTMALCAIEKKL